MSPATRQRALLASVLGLLLILFGMWVAGHLKWVEESRRGGYKAEALRNPYHAGLLLMRAAGYGARRLDAPEQAIGLATNTSLLLADPENWQTQDRRAALVDWVNRGGHLILNIESDTDLQSLQSALGIHSVSSFLLRQHDDEDGEAPLTAPSAQAQDDVLSLSDANTPLSLRIEGVATQLNLHYFTGFRSRSRAHWATQVNGNLHAPHLPEPTPEQAHVEDDEAQGDDSAHFVREAGGTTQLAIYARFALGRGWVTVGNLSPLRNTNIEKADHAQLFVRLASLPHDKRPLLVLPPSRSQNLGEWLQAKAWPALLATLLLALLLLWRVMPRFGPRLPDEVPARPGLLPHLAAVGDFMLREQAFEALIEPLRQQVTRRLIQLRGHHPELDSLAALGARLSGLPQEAIERALSQRLADKHDFLACSRSLARLQEAIRHLTHAPHSSSGTAP